MDIERLSPEASVWPVVALMTMPHVQGMVPERRTTPEGLAELFAKMPAGRADLLVAYDDEGPAAVGWAEGRRGGNAVVTFVARRGLTTTADIAKTMMSMVKTGPMAPKRLEAGIRVDNRASRLLARRIGFKDTGRYDEFGDYLIKVYRYG